MSMWYLIIPPFVVIFGLGVLLWYLSRRMNEPATIEKMEALKASIDSGATSRSLNRRAFFLKLLEKNASRFKTGTLRMHNFFQYSLEGLRAKRKQLDEMRKATEDRRRADAPPVEKHLERRKAVEDRRKADASLAEKRRFFGKWGKKGGTTAVAEPVVAPSPLPKQEASEPGTSSLIQRPGRSFKALLRRRDLEKSDDGTPTTSEAERSFAPTVSRRVTTPDAVVAISAEKSAREETLIARIAENPKDAVAYEELGDHYFATQSMQDAKACYRQALKLHPTNRAVKVKIRRLEKFFEGGAL